MLRRFLPSDTAFLRRAVHACDYGQGIITFVDALTAIATGTLHYWIANERCGGGLWWKTPQEGWLVLFFREAVPHGLRTDCRLLREGMRQSMEGHEGAYVYAAVEANNPHADGLLFVHEHLFGLKPFQTITRSERIE